MFWNHFRNRNTSGHEQTPDENSAKDNYFDFFQSVFTTDNGVIPRMATARTSNIGDINITDDGIRNLLFKIDLKEASGPDNIPNGFLKRYAGWCSRYPSLIFRKSLLLSKLPDDWILAKIIRPLRHRC